MDWAVYRHTGFKGRVCKWEHMFAFMISLFHERKVAYLQQIQQSRNNNNGKDESDDSSDSDDDNNNGKKDDISSIIDNISFEHTAIERDNFFQNMFEDRKLRKSETNRPCHIGRCELCARGYSCYRATIVNAKRISGGQLKIYIATQQLINHYSGTHKAATEYIKYVPLFLTILLSLFITILLSLFITILLPIFSNMVDPHTAPDYVESPTHTKPASDHTKIHSRFQYSCLLKVTNKKENGVVENEYEFLGQENDEQTLFIRYKLKTKLAKEIKLKSKLEKEKDKKNNVKKGTITKMFTIPGRITPLPKKIINTQINFQGK